MFNRRRLSPNGLSQQQIVFIVVVIVAVLGLGLLYTQSNVPEEMETNPGVEVPHEAGKSSGDITKAENPTVEDIKAVKDINFDFNGNTLHVVEYSNHASDYVYILIHGASKTTQNADYWTPVIPALRKTGTVYAVDLFGHGKSTSKTTPDASMQANAIISFIHQHITKTQHITLVARSAGGSIALLIADKLLPSALILTAPAIKESQISELSQNVATLPVLLLWSEADPVIPFAKAEKIKSAFVHSSLESIATPTHTLEEEEPSWWCGKVLKFMKDNFYHKAIGKIPIDHLGDEEKDERERQYPEE